MSELEIKKQLVKDTPYKFGRKNGKKYITVHMTDNYNKGADAQAHANLQSNGNSRGAAWHWQVDDKVAIQSFTHDFQLWAAGDGRGNGNLNSIHVEICVNKDGDYIKAVNNGAKLVRYIADMENIPISAVVQHNKWSGKNCPRDLREGRGGITWDKFKDLVRGQKYVAPTPTPSQPASNPAPTKTSNYTGGSIVDYLKSIGEDSSFSNRAKLAKQYGITDYKGTADQNAELLNKMRSGATPSTQPRTNALTVGQIVTLNKNAQTFATGQTIADFAKGKQYRILQVKSDRVLLDGIMSWVRKSDVS